MDISPLEVYVCHQQYAYSHRATEGLCRPAQRFVQPEVLLTTTYSKWLYKLQQVSASELHIRLQLTNNDSVLICYEAGKCWL